LRQRLCASGTGIAAVCLPDSLELPRFKEGKVLTFAVFTLDDDGHTRLAPEDESAVATLRDNPGFQRALAYLRDR